MYIDPNTGGVIFQALVAIFAVFSGVLLVFSSQIRAFIARLRRRGREEQDDNKQ